MGCALPRQVGIGGQTYPNLQRQHIEEGLADAENGRTISSDVFWNKLRNA